MFGFLIILYDFFFILGRILEKVEGVDYEVKFELIKFEISKKMGCEFKEIKRYLWFDNGFNGWYNLIS